MKRNVFLLSLLSQHLLYVNILVINVRSCKMKSHSVKHLVIIILRKCILIVTHFLKHILETLNTTFPFKQFWGSQTFVFKSSSVKSLRFAVWNKGSFFSVNLTWKIRKRELFLCCLHQFIWRSQLLNDTLVKLTS